MVDSLDFFAVFDLNASNAVGASGPITRPEGMETSFLRSVKRFGSLNVVWFSFYQLLMKWNSKIWKFKLHLVFSLSIIDKMDLKVSIIKDNIQFGNG